MVFPVFHPAGADYRRLGVNSLPGDGLFFFLFHLDSSFPGLFFAAEEELCVQPEKTSPGKNNLQISINLLILIKSQL